MNVHVVEGPKSVDQKYAEPQNTHSFSGINIKIDLSLENCITSRA